MRNPHEDFFSQNALHLKILRLYEKFKERNPNLRIRDLIISRYGKESLEHATLAEVKDFLKYMEEN